MEYLYHAMTDVDNCPANNLVCDKEEICMGKNYCPMKDPCYTKQVIIVDPEENEI